MRRSRIKCLASFTFSEWVKIFIPSAQCSEQAVKSPFLRPPSISTTHIRHEPSGANSFIWQRVGISIPREVAAVKIVVSFSTSHGIPFISI